MRNEEKPLRNTEADRARKRLDLKRKSLTDIWAFAELIAFKGGISKFDTFHREMSEHYTEALQPKRLEALKSDPELFAKHANTFVNIVARGYLKSTVNTILYTLWRIYRNPDIRICICTNNQSLAYSFIRELRSYFEDTELMLSVWDARPHIPGKLIPNLKVTKNARGASSEDTDASDGKVIWNNVALQVLRFNKTKEPTIAISSANSINTGNHYDLVIFDDVVDFDNSNTQVKRTKIQRWVNEVESQLDPLAVVPINGSTVALDDVIGYKMVNGTLYYDEDLYCKYIEKTETNPRISIFFRNIYVNGTDATNGYNWQSKFTNAVIEEIKSRIDDPAVFAAQYENRTLQQFRVDTNDIRHLINSNDTPVSGHKVVDITYEGNTYTVPLFGAMDIASKHDYSILIVGAYVLPDVFVIVDAISNRGSLDKFLRDSYQMVQERYPVSMCFVEANGVGGGCKTALGMLHQQYKSTKPLRFTEIWQTESKAMRIAFALQYMTDNKVLYMGAVSPNSEVVRQIKAYPSEYDDAIDCLSTCLYRFPKLFRKEGGVQYRKSELDNSRRINAKLRQIFAGTNTNSIRPNQTSLRNNYVRL
jgi:predicted phage terminase large subunit-like protein